MAEKYCIEKRRGKILSHRASLWIGGVRTGGQGEANNVQKWEVGTKVLKSGK